MQRDEEPEAIVDNGDDFYCESDSEDERWRWKSSLTYHYQHEDQFDIFKDFACNYSWVWAMST